MNKPAAIIIHKELQNKPIVDKILNKYKGIEAYMTRCINWENILEVSIIIHDVLNNMPDRNLSGKWVLYAADIRIDLLNLLKTAYDGCILPGYFSIKFANMDYQLCVMRFSYGKEALFKFENDIMYKQGFYFYAE